MVQDVEASQTFISIAEHLTLICNREQGTLVTDCFVAWSFQEICCDYTIIRRDHTLHQLIQIYGLGHLLFFHFLGPLRDVVASVALQDLHRPLTVREGKLLRVLWPKEIVLFD